MILEEQKHNNGENQNRNSFYDIFQKIRLRIFQWLEKPLRFKFGGKNQEKDGEQEKITYGPPHFLGHFLIIPLFLQGVNL